MVLPIFFVCDQNVDVGAKNKEIWMFAKKLQTFTPNRKWMFADKKQTRKI